MLRPSQIEMRVRELLKEQGVLEPHVPVDKIAYKLGAVVRKEPFKGEGEVSGVLDRSGDVPVIGVNSLDAPERIRFTIAHEIGHLLLHADPLHLDPRHQVGVMPGAAGIGPALRFKRDKVSSEATDYREIEANRFAASLLMPQDFLAKDLKKMQPPVSVVVVERLAKRYAVSQQAMTFRLMNLGVATETV